VDLVTDPLDLTDGELVSGFDDGRLPRRPGEIEAVLDLDAG
jgi:hypothetical protein